MERITLYYRGLPITHHLLYKSHFSIGPHPASDLVLAGSAAEQELTIYRTKSGKWQARRAADPATDAVNLDRGTHIEVGPFSVTVESAENSINKKDRKAPAETPQKLEWAGRSPVMHQLRGQTEILAPLNAPVLITGESGTGKELIARGLHNLSHRKDGPFIAVNCGGFTESLLEDTLFGHEKGAFTGAATTRRGIFEQARGGTLFLDEIGDLPLSGQAALLRVLDQKCVCRLGGEQSDAVDFRLVTATHRDLKHMVRRKTFRLDLFHRISTLRIETFALRDHLEDVEDLAEHYFAEIASELGPRRLDSSAMERIAAHRWPGNVRELRNVLYRSAALCRNAVLSAEHIDLPIVATGPKLPIRLAKLSPKHLAELLAGHDGNIAAAARALGVPRTSLRDRIKADQNELLQSMDLTG